MNKKFKYAEDCMRHWQVSSSTSSHPIVFDSIKSVPDDAKAHEAMDILIAGADTTASTLTTGIYHILSNPKCKEHLVKEIDEAMPKAGTFVSLQALEKVEFLVRSNLVHSSSLIIGFALFALPKLPQVTYMMIGSMC